ncbi:hypothetical protein B0H12DRAFT_1230402 [Mycena haematopus]|nr:hypothetical protein B0H12DRAFT_1230402 [Mycena haematopus]
MAPIDFIMIPRTTDASTSSTNSSDNAHPLNFLTWPDLPAVLAIGTLYIFFLYLSIKESRRIHSTSNSECTESPSQTKSAWDSNETLVSGRGSITALRQEHDVFVVYLSILYFDSE